MTRADPEFRLQCALVQHLRLAAEPNVEWFAIPNGEFRSKRTAGRLKAAGTKPGQPDLCIIVKGKAHGLELKSEKGRQSPIQRYVEGCWNDAGAVYEVARGIDEALAFLRAWGALSPSYQYVPARRLQSSLPLEDVAA